MKLKQTKLTQENLEVLIRALNFYEDQVKRIEQDFGLQNTVQSKTEKWNINTLKGYFLKGTTLIQVNENQEKQYNQFTNQDFPVYDEFSKIIEEPE